ncbi:hypothetical protein SARC_05014 [Sphaeroforma arctica JP610]|uniref:Uncharacterized protein n=1 Tax=Sphaeroforma arctica JP610 TaxID=667725 RepID=A0A0L0G3E2_9EUKA|nr:hypothetical protein SARC_05014 [Sphaeroforma arctica JP610]KNC82713.1 hypothetical protein SARC_05014 [Sphaeroforma arctica JP610]|eukprot:XP_014156615.1 hypothetical protein SARC_05014 [Sphaeroforma arctica JP610]
MGVNGLWHLVQPAGRPITFDDLADKVVAIDISSWVYQYMKAMRDQDGEVIKNAHLLGLFRRLCILLYHGVKPIIVFDGAAPALKLRTLSKRKQFRDRSQDTLRKTAERLFQSQMRIHALSTLAGKEVDVASLYKKPNQTEDDMFIPAEDAKVDGSVVIHEQSAEEIAKEAELARAKEQQTMDSDSDSDDHDHAQQRPPQQQQHPHTHWQPLDSVQADTAQPTAAGEGTDDADAYMQREQFLSKFLMVDVTKFDVTSEQFLALPADIQHEILVEVQERQKHWTRFNKEKASHEMSKDATSYSDMQIQRLLKKNHISRQIDDVRARLQYVNDESGVGSRRVAGDADTEFVLQYFKEDNDDGETEMKQIAGPRNVPRIANTATPPPGSVPVTVQVPIKVLDGIETDGDSDDDLFPASMFDPSHPSNFTMDDPDIADDDQVLETGKATASNEGDEDAQLQMAIAMSLGQPVQAVEHTATTAHSSRTHTAMHTQGPTANALGTRIAPPSSPDNGTDDELQMALALSLQQAQSPSHATGELKRTDSAEQLQQALALSREEMNKPRINRDPIQTSSHKLVKIPSGKGKAKADEPTAFASITVTNLPTTNGEGSSRRLTSSPFAMQRSTMPSVKHPVPVNGESSSSKSMICIPSAQSGSNTIQSGTVTPTRPMALAHPSSAASIQSTGGPSKHLTSSPFAIPFPERDTLAPNSTTSGNKGNDRITTASGYSREHWNTKSSERGEMVGSSVATASIADKSEQDVTHVEMAAKATPSIADATNTNFQGDYKRMQQQTENKTNQQAHTTQKALPMTHNTHNTGHTDQPTEPMTRTTEQDTRATDGQTSDAVSEAYGDIDDDDDAAVTEAHAGFDYLLNGDTNADDDALLNEQFGFFIDSDDEKQKQKDKANHTLSDTTGNGSQYRGCDDAQESEWGRQGQDNAGQIQSSEINITNAGIYNVLPERKGSSGPTQSDDISKKEYVRVTNIKANTHTEDVITDTATGHESEDNATTALGAPSPSTNSRGASDSATNPSPPHATTPPADVHKKVDASMGHWPTHEEMRADDQMDMDLTNDSPSQTHEASRPPLPQDQPQVQVDGVPIHVDDAHKYTRTDGQKHIRGSHGPRGGANDTDPFTDIDSLYGATTDDDAMRNTDNALGDQSEMDADGGLFAEDSDDDAMDGIIGMINMDDIEGIQGQLRQEWKQIRKEKRAAKRDASQVTEDIYSDSKTLLKLFGVPWIDSPSEAEAQCAELDRLGLCAGSITEDSDIFLFGARTVYKNMFSLSNTAELYQINDIERMLNLSRTDLINVALCSGSDYTEGIRGVGPVTSIEIISEFGGSYGDDDDDDDDEKGTQIGMTGTCVDPLVQFRDWYELNRLVPVHKDEAETAFRRKLRMAKVPLMLPRGFPDPEVRKAYTHPAVDTSTESFEFGDPDIDKLREYASAMFNWDYERTDEMLLPVVRRRMNPDKQQRRQPTLHAYFAPQAQSANRSIESKRVKTAISLQRKKKVLEATKKRNKKIRKKQMEYRPKKRKATSHESTDGTTASTGKAAKVVGTSKATRSVTRES